MRTPNYAVYGVVLCAMLLVCIYVRSPASANCASTVVRAERRTAHGDDGGGEGDDVEQALMSLQPVPPYQPSQLPIIWIGGMPRSGMRAQWKRNEKEARRLTEAGLDDTVLNAAIQSFITQIIVRHGAPAKRLCNKDPFTLKSVDYLRTIFPKSKYILMLRDARATVHSIISRSVTITGFDLKNPRQCLQKWNAAITTMYDQCQRAGAHICMPVYYEQLVLQPKKWSRAILAFLDVPWDERVLNHEKYIGKDISLSMVERSTDQLGYDPHANPPNYGKADDLVLRKTADVHDNDKKWQRQVDQIMHKPVDDAKPIADFDGHKQR